MWRGEFENRFRGWNGEKRRINNKDSMERGVSNFAEREFTFFFFCFCFSFSQDGRGAFQNIAKFYSIML